MAKQPAQSGAIDVTAHNGKTDEASGAHVDDHYNLCRTIDLHPNKSTRHKLSLLWPKAVSYDGPS